MVKRFNHVLVLIVSSVFIAACGHLIKPEIETGIESLRPGEYEVDPQHTTILFKVNHLGFAKFIGRFDKFDASLDFTPDDLSAARLSARVDMGSVNVNSEKLQETLTGRPWFNVAQYPYAGFETTKARRVDADTAIFTGNLTFLGHVAPIDIEVKFNGGGVNLLTGRYTIGFEASADFLRSEFGLDDFIPAIGDEIELEIHAEFKRL